MSPELEVEKRQRKRRDAAVAAVALRVPPFRGLDFAALGMQADEGRDVFKAFPARNGFLTQGKGFIVAADSLENCRPLAIGCFRIEREPLGAIHVGQSIVQTYGRWRAFEHGRRKPLRRWARRRTSCSAISSALT